ncbi:orph-D5 [Microplitis demolitor]|uniref:hypothetical protein n=1 Tax=Microplitis demolitor TaxID=69319 RepID=UPI000440020E|nr:hypothetical protein [Microplitis demolitor]KAG6558494.1 orph-D5 [Microplitis demolitor]
MGSSFFLCVSDSHSRIHLFVSSQNDKPSELSDTGFLKPKKDGTHSGKMLVNGKYHYICIVPQEWSEYHRSDLEKVLLKSTKNHFYLNGEIKGTNPISQYKVRFIIIALYQMGNKNNNNSSPVTEVFRYLLSSLR